MNFCEGPAFIALFSRFPIFYITPDSQISEVFKTIFQSLPIFQTFNMAFFGRWPDRPRAKAVVELQGCRSRRSWGASTKKRVDLGSLFDVEHETTPPFVDAPQLRTVPKIKYDVSGRKVMFCVSVFVTHQKARGRFRVVL